MAETRFCVENRVRDISENCLRHMHLEIKDLLKYTIQSIDC